MKMNMQRRTRSAGWFLSSAFIGLIGAVGCGNGPPPQTVITVRSGESIQAAVDRARDGMTVEVEPGTYKESINIPSGRRLQNFTLRGKVVGGQRAILEGENQRENGILASDVVAFTVEGLQIQNYTQSGVSVSSSTLGNSQNLTFRDLIVDRTGLYGIAPQLAAHVLVEASKVTGAQSAGIYMNQLVGALFVQDNEVANNVVGIECENSDDCVIRRNNAHDNAGGIVVFTLPYLPRKRCLRARIYDNTIVNNNTANSASSSDIVSNVPAGSGLTIFSARQVMAYNNTIQGNQSYGAGIFSVTDLLGTNPDPPYDIAPDPQYDLFQNNQFSGNGTSDFTFAGQTAPGGDFAYDGIGIENCQSNNGLTDPRWSMSPLDTCP